MGISTPRLDHLNESRDRAHTSNNVGFPRLHIRHYEDGPRIGEEVLEGLEEVSP
jgi:hypothetical protein